MSTPTYSPDSLKRSIIDIDGQIKMMEDEIVKLREKKATFRSHIDDLEQAEIDHVKAAEMSQNIKVER